VPATGFVIEDNVRDLALMVPRSIRGVSLRLPGSSSSRRSISKAP
jgi:hypothetical protein